MHDFRIYTLYDYGMPDKPLSDVMTLYCRFFVFTFCWIRDMWGESKYRLFIHYDRSPALNQRFTSLISEMLSLFIRRIRVSEMIFLNWERFAFIVVWNLIRICGSIGRLEMPLARAPDWLTHLPLLHHDPSQELYLSSAYHQLTQNPFKLDHFRLQ